MFTKSCLGKCSKICIFMSNKGLMVTNGLLRLPQKAPSDSPKGGAWDAGRPLRLSNFTKIREFLIAGKGQKSGFRRATRPPRGCNEHAVMLQRRPRCNAIAAPLQSRGGLTGSPSSPFGGVRGDCLFASSCLPVVCKNSDFSTVKTAGF